MRRFSFLWVLVTFLFIIGEGSAAVTVRTFKDSTFSLGQELFTDGAIVYVVATDGATCCTTKEAQLSVIGSVVGTINLYDDGSGEDNLANDGSFRGSFVIGTKPNSQGYVHLDGGQEAEIFVALTQISTGSRKIKAEYTPPTPVDLRLSRDGQTVRLSWSQAKDENGVSHYVIYRGEEEIDSESVGKAVSFQSNELNYQDSSAPDGKTYYYSVSAVDKIGNVAPVGENKQVSLPDITPPAKIGDLFAKAVKEGGIYLNWSKPVDNVETINYLIFRSDLEGERGGLLEKTSELFYLDERTVDGKTYYYTVVGIDKAENKGKDSNQVKATADRTAPKKTDLNYELRAKGGVYLNWSGVEDVAYYKVYRSQTKNVEQEFIEVSSLETDYLDMPGLSLVFYSVVAVDLAGNEAQLSNIIEVSPDSIAPPSPQNLQIASLENGHITLLWVTDQVDDLKGFNIYRNEDGKFEGLLAYAFTTLTSFEDSGLENNKTYYYIVRAVDLVGNEDGNNKVLSKTVSDTKVNLLVSYPDSNFTSGQFYVIVAGKVDLDAKLSITNVDDKDIFIDKKGGFLTTVPLGDGENVISIEAIDVNNNKAYYVFKVRNSLPSIAEEPLLPQLEKSFVAIDSSGPHTKVESLAISKEMLSLMEHYDKNLRENEEGLIQITGLVTGGGIKGGVSVLLVAGVIIVLLAIAGGLFYFKSKDTRHKF